MSTISTTKKSIVLFLALVLTASGLAFTQGWIKNNQNRQNNRNIQTNQNGQNKQNRRKGYDLADYPVSDLSVQEEEGLLFIFEEEKLARDVYNMLYSKWNLPIFSNIAQSEQTHMDEVAALFERYGLPVKPGAPGVFSNPELAALYAGFVEKGSIDLVSALNVGATIEDLDIADLYRLISETDNQDIKVVYANLQKGSRNHLRSFYSQLEKNGSTYTATFITDEQFEKIISTPKEQGPVKDL
jgi:hypothetical protein